MKLLLTLLGLIMVLEALPYVAYPQAMQEWLRQIDKMPPKILRVLGLCYLTQRTTLLG